MVDKQQLETLALKDPLSWGIINIDLLEGKQWEIDTRRWSLEPYQKLNPWVIENAPEGEPRRMTIIKSTQAGISTAALTKALHFADNWPVRIGYTLPRQQDTLDFVTTRVDPILASSPKLREKLGQPNSSHAKRIGNSYLFFMEMSTEPRMMPLDAVFVDEVDLSSPDNLASVLNRMDASRWKINFFLSTPTVANYGIHGLYLSSDMRRWMVKCPFCGTHQHLDWDKNLRIIGARNNPDRVFYGCIKCNEELTPAQIQLGQWVPEHPALSETHVGYHVSQMMTTPAPYLYRTFLDPQTTLIEFYRKRLGMPYEMGGGSVSRDDFLSTCFDDPYDFEAWDGRSVYFLGADQGNEIQAIISKLEPGKSRPKIVHIELIPLEHGFDRLSQLIQVFHIRKGVVDANPNRHDVVSLVKKFPGRIIAADYVEQREATKAKMGISSLPGVITNVAINRTSGFDGLMQSIKNGEWALPGSPPQLQPDVELLIDHVTALKRDVESRRTPSGEVQVAVWRKLRPEHLAHAWLYMKTAIELDKGRGMKLAIIGKAPEAVVVQEPSPDEDVVIAIIEQLAEVPGRQLKGYMEARYTSPVEDYKPPFPLSAKLPNVEGVYSSDDILWVLKRLIVDKEAQGT